MNKIIVADLINYLENFVLEERKQRISEVLMQRTRHITIVLEDLYQPHNISAVLRTADCLGLQDVHIIEKSYDFKLNTQITMGSDKWLSIQHYQGQNSVKDCILKLKSQGYKIVATLPYENNALLDDCDYTQKMALIFGTELTGLSSEIIEMADEYVKIPMYGFTESFNISVSAALVMHHLTEKLRKSSINWQLSPSEREELKLEWLQKSIKKSDLIIDNYLKNKYIE